MRIEIKDKELIEQLKKADIKEDNIEYFENIIKLGITFYSLLNLYAINEKKANRVLKNIINKMNDYKKNNKISSKYEIRKN